MKLKYLYLFLFLPFLVQAQQIKRWTFCGVGQTGKVKITNISNIVVATTLGQCPGCKVISDGTTTLRQGFQQPTIDQDSSGTNSQDCLYKVAFSNTFKTDICGTYYAFEYEGDQLPGMTYSWDFGSDGYPEKTTDLNPSNIGFKNTGLQIVKLTVTNKTCTKSQSAIINVPTKAFIASAKPTNILCKGNKQGAVTLSVFGGTAPVSFKWSNNETAQNLTNISGGDYTYIATDANGCISKNTVTVKEPQDSFKVAAKVKDESCKDGKDGEISLAITGGQAPFTYFWSDNANTQNRVSLEKGLYVVTVTDTNLCATGITVDLKRYCEKTEKDFPNTFSPNGDGVNDGWEFPGIDDFPKNEVVVFNRWGNPVWDKSSMKNGEWMGQNNKGQDLPSGPYYFLIHLNDRDNTVFSGAVTIIR